jgi:hypothetical protein
MERGDEALIAVVATNNAVVATNTVLSSPGLTGRSSTPCTLGSIASVSGILDHPLSRMMTIEFVGRGVPRSAAFAL